MGSSLLEGEPQRRAGAGRTAGGADSRLVEVPLLGLRANELQGPGGVSQRRLDRRLDFVFHAVLHVPVVDGDDGDALVEKGLRIGLLVAPLPAAAVDVKHDRRRLVGLSLVEIEHLPRMAAVGQVRQAERFFGAGLQRQHEHGDEWKDSFHGGDSWSDAEGCQIGTIGTA
jgi:hypothetical protein